MARAENSQFNVRSSYARDRAHELARLTGMTATQVVEDALRSYVPPGGPKPVGRLVQRGPLLVLSSCGAEVSLEAANVALDAAREREV